MKEMRWNVLLLALMGALLIVALAASGSADGVDTLAATLLGAVATVMLKLCEPPPDPSVSAEALEKLLGKALNAESAQAPPPLRRNVLLLALIGSGVALAIFVLAGYSQAALNVAAAMVGGIAAGMAKLVDPDDPTLPASVVKDVLEARQATRST